MSPPAGSFDQASQYFQTRFHEAAANRNLPEFAEACRATLESAAADPFYRPYAFAYSARAMLHDLAFWEPATIDGEETFRPREALLARLDELLQFTSALNDRNNYYYEIVKGIRHDIAGEAEEAFRWFALAARPHDFYRVVKDDFGGGAAFARTLPSANDLAAARGTRFARDLRFHCRPEVSPSAVVSISCDRIYAEAFASGWIAGLAAASTGQAALHLHLMFRGAADGVLLARLQQEASHSGLLLAISVEEHTRAFRAYYASGRFLKGQAILAAFGCPVLFADADSYITDAVAFRERHLPCILAETRAIRFRADGPYNGYLPWRRFSATWLTMPATDWAADFLALVGDAVEYFWDDRDHNWWIDQMALEIAYRQTLQWGQPAGRFLRLDRMLPHMLSTGEDHKIRMVSAIPQMQALMAQGLNYWEALRRADG